MRINCNYRLYYFLEKDRSALGIPKRKFYFYKSPVWRYEIYLRKVEYYRNVSFSKWWWGG